MSRSKKCKSIIGYNIICPGPWNVACPALSTWNTSYSSTSPLGNTLENGPLFSVVAVPN